jgi:hypothetical protein
MYPLFTHCTLPLALSIFVTISLAPSAEDPGITKGSYSSETMAGECLQFSSDSSVDQPQNIPIGRHVVPCMSLAGARQYVKPVFFFFAPFTFHAFLWHIKDRLGNLPWLVLFFSRSQRHFSGARLFYSHRIAFLCAIVPHFLSNSNVILNSGNSLGRLLLFYSVRSPFFLPNFCSIDRQ